jgi:hypothetical protein
VFVGEGEAKKVRRDESPSAGNVTRTSGDVGEDIQSDLMAAPDVSEMVIATDVTDAVRRPLKLGDEVPGAPDIERSTNRRKSTARRKSTGRKKSTARRKSTGRKRTVRLQEGDRARRHHRFGWGQEVEQAQEVES